MLQTNYFIFPKLVSYASLEYESSPLSVPVTRQSYCIVFVFSFFSYSCLIMHVMITIQLYTNLFFSFIYLSNNLNQCILSSWHNQLKKNRICLCFISMFENCLKGPGLISLMLCGDKTPKVSKHINCYRCPECSGHQKCWCLWCHLIVFMHIFQMQFTKNGWETGEGTCSNRNRGRDRVGVAVMQVG